MDDFKKRTERTWCCGACDKRRQKPTWRKRQKRIARARLKVDLRRSAQAGLNL